MDTPKTLNSKQVRPYCDPTQFTFSSTAELPDLPGIIGQDRATRALHFGMGVKGPGYNVFVLGPAGAGKATAVRQSLEQDAALAPPANDWIYLYNFEKEGQPNAVSLPSGLGRSLRDNLQEVLKELQSTIPAAFEDEDYIKERDKIIGELNKTQEEQFQQLTAAVEKYNFSLIRLPGGFVLMPVVGGKPITEEQFEQLSDEQKEKLRQLREKLQENVDKTMIVMRKNENAAKAQMAVLDERVARFTIEHPVKEIKAHYEDLPEMQEHLDAMQEDLVANVEAFKNHDGAEDGMAAAMQMAGGQGLLRRYGINLFVDNGDAEGAPVVQASNPNFANLVGRIEHQAVMGALITDFTMIRPGALHQANGGYLVIDALALLQRPQAYDALKRALKDREIRVEEYAQSLGLISTAILEPEPIPLDLKVVLTGPSWLYYMLQTNDEDFNELFKVQADFDDRMPRDAESIQDCAQFIATLCRHENLRHFSTSGVARIVDHSSRLVSDQRYLSTRFRDIADLIIEANFWASEAERELITNQDVQRAIDEKMIRGNLYEERLGEAIARGEILVSVTGKRVGQINGLSVFPMANAAFGKPTRITARTHMGRGGVIDIEREVKLGGPIHSKGVMILAAFLGGRYAQEKPLSLRATLVFEQSYAGVEGDSASLAELCALISSLADVPLRQDLAITGSVNQHGDVQTIGGINEKVEGFFDTCRLLGDLTGEQGVILPIANVQHLELREDVVEAVKEDRFHLYPVERVDQAVELLTELSAGAPDEDGVYPPNTVNGMITIALEFMHERWQALRSNGDSENGIADEGRVS